MKPQGGGRNTHRQWAWNSEMQKITIHLSSHLHRHMHIPACCACYSWAAVWPAFQPQFAEKNRGSCCWNFDGRLRKAHFCHLWNKHTKPCISFLLPCEQLPQAWWLHTTHFYYLPQFPGIRSPGMTWLDPLLRASGGWNQGAGWASFLPFGRLD